ncbi:MAG: molybdenum cofactor biosynthesis protein B [Gammaproteobacteria bacterium]|nr:molybdenum cofactor biosynthesis protein B [Gammaproteobacteria bacterium]
MKTVEFIQLHIAVLVISDSRTSKTDVSGQVLTDRIQKSGHIMSEKTIVPDNIYQIREKISHWIADPHIQIIVSTGGTGVTGRDGTPEAMIPLFDKTLEGFGELFRSISYQEIGTSSLQSRAVAGVANGTYMFCLPGSASACRTAWDNIIEAQLDIRTKPCNLVQLIPRLTEQG